MRASLHRPGPPRRLPALLLASAGALLAALAPACRTSPPPRLAGGEVRNLTSASAREVQVLHHPTGGMARVNEILPGRSFKLAFASEDLLARSATVSWRTTQGDAFTRELEIPPCPPELRDGEVWIVYSIRPGGAVEVAFERPLY